MSAGLQTSRASEGANITVDVEPRSASDAELGPVWTSSTWTYAVVAPFPTIVDGLTAVELRAAWDGSPPDSFAATPLRMAADTRSAFARLWGEPAADAVQVLPADMLLEAAWQTIPSLAIVPFEELQPRWKVLTLDGQSPARNDFDPSRYALSLTFTVRSSLQDAPALVESWPATNRDPGLLTTVMMTGVTALVRFTAVTMNTKGVLYPGRDIRDWMRGADIAHISNEIPFWGGCEPSRSPNRLVFCSDPSYVQLLQDIGADVIELSGDHFGDYGPDATALTIEMYNELGLAYYGGGINLEDAREPLLMEHHGNRIAFYGCNAKGRGGALAYATDTKPGAFPCDFTYMTARIRELVSEGYLVISTFQWHESQTFSPTPFVTQIEDFRRMADAGAAIVSGSQAHAPQSMEFYEDAFIHYGLGNLFFDQMGDLTGQPESVRDEFLDLYTIYDGRVIGVDLLTAKLEDYSRPRPMTDVERREFLTGMFTYSGWLSPAPPPSPEPTLTLTPIQLPPAAVTATP